MRISTNELIGQASKLVFQVKPNMSTEDAQYFYKLGSDVFNLPNASEVLIRNLIAGIFNSTSENCDNLDEYSDNEYALFLP